jgi:hypothetical protein
LDRDALDHLADALMEDIAASSGDDLLAEVEEDFGNMGVLAVAFDLVLANAEALALRQPQDEAMGHLADALREDIAAVSPEALLREVAEDYGDGRALVAEFDRAVFGGADLPSTAEKASVETLIVREVQLQAAAAGSPRRKSGSLARLRAAVAPVLDWLAAPLHARTAVAAFAALVLFVIAAPRLLERSADRIEKSADLTNTELSANSSFSLRGTPSSVLPVSPWMPEQDRMPANPKLSASAASSPADMASAARGMKQDTAGPSLLSTPVGEHAAAPPTAAMRRTAPQMKTVPGDEEPKRLQSEREIVSSRARVAASVPAAPAPSGLTAPPLPTTPQSADANRPEQIRQAQTELSRLGCFTGKPDGLLNDETQKAVEAFWTRTGRPATRTGISNELVADLRRQPDGMCNAGLGLPAGAGRAPAAAAPPINGR